MPGAKFEQVWSRSYSRTTELWSIDILIGPIRTEKEMWNK
jgi:hypothetical protein